MVVLYCIGAGIVLFVIFRIAKWAMSGWKKTNEIIDGGAIFDQWKNH